METKTLLVHAVTRYDREQAAKHAKNRKHYYNHYALGIYLGRVDSIVEDVAAGATLPDAIKANFNDRLRDYVLKFCSKGDPAW